MRIAREAPRGFTLLELMVAGTLGVLVTMAAYGIFRAQNQSMQSQTSKMAMQDNARAALEFIAVRGRDASFGVDPSFGLDANVYGCSTGGQTTTTPNCRDGGASGTDQLVFYSRDKMYFFPPGTTPVGHAWTVNSVGSNSLTINRRGTAAGDGYTFYPGQIVEVLCSGASTYTYATVDAKADPPSTAQAQSLTLKSASTGDPTNRGDLLASNGCFSTARVVPVDLHHFFIQSYGTGTATTPYLMYDRGLDLDPQHANFTSSTLSILASDVEDFQVSYAMASGAQVYGPTATTFASLPNFSGTPTQACPTGATPNFYDLFSLRPCAPGSPERLTVVPQNTVALRVTLVMRSQVNQDIGGDPQPALENHTTVSTTRDHRNRLQIGTSISLLNMLSQSNFL